MKRLYEETENEGKQEEKPGYNKNIIEQILGACTHFNYNHFVTIQFSLMFSL